MAKKNGNVNGSEETTALATMPAESAALVEALDGLDVGAGGLEEVDQSDIRIAAKVWNFKGVDAAGDPIAPNVYFDTVEETAKKELSLVFLTLHKSKEWREYDEAEGRSRIRCRSNDRAMGIMEDGTERPCQGCPDAQWRSENGKRTRRCGDIYGVVAVDRETQQPCILRFKRTSLPVIQSHLQKHHLGKLVQGPGKRANVPLFAYSVRATLKMSDDKKYALPVLERGAVLPKADIDRYSADAKFWREHILPAMEVASKVDADAPAAGDGTDFDFGANAPAGDRFADDRLR